MSPDIPSNQMIHEIFPSLRDTYLAGGCVRDILLDRLPIDFDLVALKNPEASARAIASHTGGHLVQLGKPGLILYRIISPKVVIDIQEAKGGTIETDLKQRDFTINAMAYRMDTGRVIDLHIADLPDHGARRIRGPTVCRARPLIT